MSFDGGEVGSGSGDFAVINDFAAAYGEADAIHLGLVEFESGDDAEVSGHAIEWLVGVLDEVHGVGPRSGVGETTLGEATNFEGGAVLPFGAVGSAKECGVFEGGAGCGVDYVESRVVGHDGVVGVAK